MIVSILLLLVTAASAGPGNKEISDQITEIEQNTKEIDQKLQRRDIPAQTQAELQRQRSGNLDKIDKIADTAPESAPVQTRALGAFMTVNEPGRALPRAERVVELAPRDPQAYVMRGQVKRALGDYSAAEKDAALALKMDPGNKDAQMLYALTHGRGGAAGGGGRAGGQAAAPAGVSASGASMPPAARKTDPPAAYSAAPAVHPASVLIAAGSATADRLKAFDFFKQAQAKAALGDDAAAKSLLDKAVAADARSPQVLAARAQARVRTGDARGGLADANAALVLDGRSALAYLARGAAREALGEPVQAALSDYMLAAELDPDLGPEAQKALARHGRGGAKPAESGARSAAGNLMGGSLPPLARRALPFALLGLGLLVAAGGALWLRRDSNPS